MAELYDWVYPGVMVGVTGVFVGYVVGFLYPGFMSGSNPGPLFMALVAVIFTFVVAWIAQRGANASTAVNLAINIIQISALVLFSILAIGYRTNHPQGAKALNYDSSTLATYTYNFATKADGTVIRDASVSRSTVPFQMELWHTLPRRTRERPHRSAAAACR